MREKQANLHVQCLCQGVKCSDARLTCAALQVRNVHLMDTGVLSEVDPTPAFGFPQFADVAPKLDADIYCHLPIFGLVYPLVLVHTLSGDSNQARQDRKPKLKIICTALLIAGIVIGVVYFCVTKLGSVIQAANAKNSANSLSSDQPSSPSLESTFTSIQNDSEGYNGLKWGTPGTPSALGRCNGPTPPETSGPRQNDEALRIIFNIPTNKRVTGSEYWDANYDVIPRMFEADNIGDTMNVYYGGRFVMAYVTVDANQANQVYDALHNRYIDIGTQDTRVTTLGGSTDTEITLFKRGNTNTRIYYIDQSHREDERNETIRSTHLLYLPTEYMWAMQHDIQSLIDAYVSKYNAEHPPAPQKQPETDKVQ